MLGILFIAFVLFNVGASTSESPTECEPIQPNLTSPKTGQKAFDKCIEYQEKYVYPCEKGLEGSARSNHCTNNAESPIISGADAAKDEFRHMALIGYDEPPRVKWLCGGAVISDRFILTAGHCMQSRDSGYASNVIVGALRMGDGMERQYKIKAVHQHPDFKPPKKYDDIALLETEDQIELNEFVVPGCLDVGDELQDSAMATTWQSIRGKVSEYLQKIPMRRFPDDECSEIYHPTRILRGGINFTTQLCYAPNHTQEGCQTDTGGPLQIKSKKLYCMYTIIGVASFGRHCAVQGVPDIFTRVAAYVPWIESVVWP